MATAAHVEGYRTWPIQYRTPRKKRETGPSRLDFLLFAFSEPLFLSSLLFLSGRNGADSSLGIVKVSVLSC